MLDTSRLRSLAISESGFIFDPITGHTFNVNSTGYAIIQALKDDMDEEQIVAHLQEQFDIITGDDLARDIEEFIISLRAQGLVD